MPKKSFKKIIVILLTVGVLISLNNYLLDNFVQNLFYKVTNKSGTFIIEKYYAVADFSRSLLEAKEVVKENERLREENNILLGQVAEIEGLERENELLRDELQVARRLDSRLLIVQLFNIQKDALSSTALINKGKSSGIEKSMAVIMSGNILVGLVDEVFEDSARIILLDDPRAKINARVKDTNILAETKGELNDRLSLDLVTQKDDIKEGDMIITSGLDGFKESLPIGSVESVGTGGSNLFQKIIIKPLFDLSLGSSLFVILD
ncbi:MAG: rod shape-determining protein MreC [Candidatus Paceibacterota bacterium]